MTSTDADGVREAIRRSYRIYRDRLVWQELPDGMTLHAASLYGALAARYAVARCQVSEICLLAELAPFVQLPEFVGVEMLAEYAVFKEVSHECNTAALADHVVTGLEQLDESERESVLSEATRNKVAWIMLLA